MQEPAVFGLQDVVGPCLTLKPDSIWSSRLSGVATSQISPDSITVEGVTFPIIQRSNVSSDVPALFIVNGEQSRLFARPYQASIQFYRSPFGWLHLCGATIIGVDKVGTSHIIGVDKVGSSHIIGVDKVGTSHIIGVDKVGSSHIIGVDKVGTSHIIGVDKVGTSHIIGVDKLVTAAHCLTPFPASLLRVEVGVLDLSKDPLILTQIRNVSTVYAHENFTASPGAVYNDIGVVFLTHPLVYNDNVQPAKLSPGGQAVDNLSCVVSGWGRTGPNSPQSPVLLEGKMSTQSFRNCQTLMGEFGVTITRDQLCAKAESANGSGPCFGDSGGPLMCGKNYKFLTGVASATLNCDVSIPTLFTKVSNYIDWINQKYKLFRKQQLQMDL
ncbi:Chymotrypsin-like elastase member 2A [Bulinus truncatus]|nr:Chymotrypsin-like elastase member 2A [Bulinus truncatus]